MKDGNVNGNDCTSRVLSERQAEVLDELQVPGENGCSSLYCRTLKVLKDRLVLDDEYDPSDNLSLLRVLTMLERDVMTLSQRCEEYSDEIEDCLEEE